MDISKTDIDQLNSVINMTIDRKDYEKKVGSVLSDYRKNANIPGFRKGHTPIGLIKKQYGISVKVDEINKLMQKRLSDYLGEVISIGDCQMPRTCEEAVLEGLRAAHNLG